MFRAAFWVVLPCKMIVDRRFRGAYCLHHLWNACRQSFYTAVQPRRQLWTSYSPPWELEIIRMMEAVRISETSVDNYFTRQYIPEDNSELHTRRCENLKSSGWWRQYVPLKRRSTIILHGSTSQKTILNIMYPLGLLDWSMYSMSEYTNLLGRSVRTQSFVSRSVDNENL
jgi:hypothetical protein